MMCWGLRYCTARAHIVLAREQIVPAKVCGQNVKFSSCNSIHSTPSCLCRTWSLIQVTVLGFSYLCATWRSQNFYREGHFAGPSCSWCHPCSGIWHIKYSREGVFTAATISLEGMGASWFFSQEINESPDRLFGLQQKTTGLRERYKTFPFHTGRPCLQDI